MPGSRDTYAMHAAGAPRGGGGSRSSSNTGAAAASSWIQSRGIGTTGLLRWNVEIALDVLDRTAPADFDEKIATRFHVDIYSEEWGVFFCHAGRSSWIRVTDIPFVHGRDDHGLLGITPALEQLGRLVRLLEQRHVIQFQRAHARVVTNVASAEPAIRKWIAAL